MTTQEKNESQPNAGDYPPNQQVQGYNSYPQYGYGAYQGYVNPIPQNQNASIPETNYPYNGYYSGYQGVSQNTYPQNLPGSAASGQAYGGYIPCYSANPADCANPSQNLPAQGWNTTAIDVKS